MENIYNSVFFIFLFLLFIAVIELLDNKDIKYKKILVITVSIALIGYLDFYSLVSLTLASTGVYYVINSTIDLKKHVNKITIFGILLLVIIKNYYYLIDTQNIYIPLGISYYYFRLLSVLIDNSRNRIKIRPLHYMTYVFYLPIFLAGPIQRYNTFEMTRQYEPEKFKNMVLFFCLLILKLYLVDIVLVDAQIKNHAGLESSDPWSMKEFLYYLQFSVFSFFHAYFDLMLYTELSITLSKLLGFNYQENFNRPLLASNISLFWQRWHMSLSNWTRDYVFFPILIKTKNQYFATYCSMLTIGLWHGASLNWIIWALSHATAINLYGIYRKTKFYHYMTSTKTKQTILRITGVFFTITFVILIFSITAFAEYHHAS